MKNRKSYLTQRGKIIKMMPRAKVSAVTTSAIHSLLLSLGEIDKELEEYLNRTGTKKKEP